MLTMPAAFTMPAHHPDTWSTRRIILPCLGQCRDPIRIQADDTACDAADAATPDAMGATPPRTFASDPSFAAARL
jgi:hypothetical protein